MDHNEVSQLFIRWFIIQPQYKGWFLIPNRSGYASEEKVPYGFPPGGGGFDFIAVGPGASVEYIEIKTIAYPTLSKKQKNFKDKMLSLDFKCWIFKEMEAWPGFYIVPAQDYRTYRKWPY